MLRIHKVNETAVVEEIAPEVLGVRMIRMTKAVASAAAASAAARGVVVPLVRLDLSSVPEAGDLLPESIKLAALR